ncbi:MAG: signal recognition particle protein [Chloroflexi bacterium]|nr:signal recognition particle protein [Chloroflexota bacterium]
MFEDLTAKLQGTFDRLAGKGKLNENDVKTAMREVKLALLEADVNFKVVKDLVARINERCIGAEVMKSLTPAQQVIKIVNEELIAILGDPGKLDLSGTPPQVIMLVGLQGSGKTTTAAKLASLLRKKKQRPLLVAADIYRPAAIAQLETLGKQLDIPVFSEGTAAAPPKIVAHALRQARQSANTVVILDTAGRLQIDEPMMRELEQVKERSHPAEILLVADAMTGQEAVNVAREFHKRVGLTGLILTKIDGDARGGAALSIRQVTGVPIKFTGTGEKLDALEPFYPDRMASRILGMGDMLTLIEKAEQAFDKEESAALEKRLRKGELDFEMFLSQLQQVKKMGSFSQILDLIPGISSIKNQLPQEVTDQQFKRIEAIISSMTLAERRNSRLLNASRKRRIARGSGTTVQEVNELLSQFRQMQRMMKNLGKMGGRGGGFQIPGLPL